MDALAEITVDAPSDDAELYLATMQRCREKLSDTDEQLLQLRYVEDLSIQRNR